MSCGFGATSAPGEHRVAVAATKNLRPLRARHVEVMCVSQSARIRRTDGRGPRTVRARIGAWEAQAPTRAAARRSLASPICTRRRLTTASTTSRHALSAARACDAPSRARGLEKAIRTSCDTDAADRRPRGEVAANWRHDQRRYRRGCPLGPIPRPRSSRRRSRGAPKSPAPDRTVGRRRLSRDCDNDGRLDISARIAAVARCTSSACGKRIVRDPQRGFQGQLGGLNLAQADKTRRLPRRSGMRGGWQLAQRRSLLRHNCDGTSRRTAAAGWHTGKRRPKRRLGGTSTTTAARCSSAMKIGAVFRKGATGLRESRGGGRHRTR